MHKNRLVIERLTALWALNECGLGGFMHAFSSPFTGIVVGGISILLISLIALHAQNVWSTLLKALSIVLLVKLSVSPHSPITAYFAVSFQAFLAMVLYSLFSINRFTVVLLGALTFLESAVQKLVTITIIYGQALWDAIDIYTQWVSDKFSFLANVLSSKTIVLAFVSFYVVAGIFVGLLIVKIIKLTQSIEALQLDEAKLLSIDSLTAKKFAKPKKHLLFWSVILIILIPLLFLQSEHGGLETALYVVARSILIIVLWYVILSPLLLKGLNRVLSKHKKVYQTDIQSTLDILPHLKSIIRYAWNDSSSFKGINRMQHFLAKSVIYSVHFNPPKR